MRKMLAIALIMLGVGLAGIIYAFDKNDWKKLEGEPFTQEKIVDAQSIQAIHAKTDTMNMNIIRGTRDDIYIQLEGKASKQHLEKLNVTAESKGDTLYIESKVKRRGLVFGWSSLNATLTVELPERLWDSIDLESDVGHITLDQLHAEKISVASDIGNIKAYHYEADQFKVESDTGNIQLLDGIGPMNVKTDIGSIRVEAEQIVHDLTLKSDTGNISINVDQAPKSAEIQIKKELGSSKIEWEGFESDNNKKYNESGRIGSGDIKIDISTEIGSVKLGYR